MQTSLGGLKHRNQHLQCIYLAIVGPRIFVPVMACSKKQSAVSHSSTESAIIALEYGLRSEGLPVLTFLGTRCETIPWRTHKGQSSRGATLEPWSRSSSCKTRSCCKTDPLWFSGPTGGIQNAQPPAETTQDVWNSRISAYSDAGRAFAVQDPYEL